MSAKYILEGKVAVRCDDLLAWGAWLENAVRHVADDTIGDVRISTVFLGLDHNWNPGGPPLLFETMIFGGDHDGDCERCSTWEQAEEQHRKAVDLVAKS